MSSQNASYAAPVSGMNQQSVQLADLDGDGTEEAVAFLKTTGDKPLKACIFSRVDEDYQLMDVIEGDGPFSFSVICSPFMGSQLISSPGTFRARHRPLPGCACHARRPRP